jgi:serine O-acetyltransferase
MFENLRRDGARYKDLGGWAMHSGFWIIAVYRLGKWAYGLPFVPRIPFLIVYRILRFAAYLVFNVDVWAHPRLGRIGPGILLIHPRNIVIGAGVEIGEHCEIFHEVTLGRGIVPGAPKIGNHVDIYVGARILGGVTIGDRSLIGANCVITKDVPPDSVVVSAPSRVLPRSLSRIGEAPGAPAASGEGRG